MPRSTLDPSYREEIRQEYFGANSKEERRRILSRACRASGYSYGGLLRVLNLKVRERSLSKKEVSRVAYLNSLGRTVWEYQQQFVSATRSISTSLACRVLKEQGVIPDNIDYFQISEAIRRQRLKNNSASHFTRFERTAPLSMVQMDFTRSVYLEHFKKNGESFLRIARPKGANSKQERVWIAVAIDDASRVAFARYYLANAESARLAQNFLLKAFAQKTILNTSTGEILPIKLLQGQPKQVYTDRGSAFRNASFKNGLLKLGIQHILGSTSIDTEGNKQPGSNKQARGKVERMIRSIKSDFESGLFLTYKVGTLFPIKEINRLFKKWLVRYNTSFHPVNKESLRWELFFPALEEAIYPPLESELLFSISVMRKVHRRQVRVDDGIYCKAPSEISSGESIEVITAGGNYYTVLNGKRVLLEVMTTKTISTATADSTPKERQEFDHDHLEGIALRSRINREIEIRTRQQQNLGSLSEHFIDTITEFLSERRSIKDLKKFTTQLLLQAETASRLSVGPEGELVETKRKH